MTVKNNLILPEARATIKAMLNEGYTQKYIASEVGCHASTVFRINKERKREAV